MGKIHYKDTTILMGAPDYVKEEYKKRGEDGALCGYIRKNTTFDRNKVTCFYCKRKVKKF